MKEFLDEHFTRLLNNRGANSGWTPSMHAHPDVAAAYPEIAGLTVVADEYIGPRTIELRTHTGKMMAEYVGVTLD
jgi:hypothetical protein